MIFPNLEVSYLFCCCCLATKLCLTLFNQGTSVHGISQARILEWVSFPSPGDLPGPGLSSFLLHWWLDSAAEPLGKPLYLCTAQLICFSVSYTIATRILSTCMYMLFMYILFFINLESVCNFH